MNKSDFIKEVRKKYGIDAHYSGNNNTMYLSGPNAKDTKAFYDKKGLDFDIEVGYHPRVKRVKETKENS